MGLVYRQRRKKSSFFTKKALECLPNKLTPLYSKIYYEEENYLKVRTKLFIYPSPPIVKVGTCYGINLTYTITHYSMLFPTVGWLTTSALAANLAYLYMLPLCTFFSSLYHNVVIQSTSLQHCDSFLIIILYFFIIDFSLVNAIAVLPKSTRLTVSI